MSSTSFDLVAVQEAISRADLDGWLFYDFRGSDPIARNILRLDPSRTTTRRWYYWVPAQGRPRKLVHAIETKALEGLPGAETVYLTWQSLEKSLAELVEGSRRIAMQYSPRNEVPYISRVDAGTVEFIRGVGVEVVTSADIVQLFDAVLSDEQLASHKRSAKVLRGLVDEAFGLVGETLRAGKVISERDVQKFVIDRFAEEGLEFDHAPIVGVNEHAADPHFEVPEKDSSFIRRGDLLLLDIWAKEQKPRAVFADITWCAMVGAEPPEEIDKVFKIVRDARDAAIARADEAFSKGEDLRGFELDRVCRKVIVDAGYGDFFIHRTGHSMHESNHGNGANLDDLETHDTRRLLPRTLFSVEPGIYLEGKFGIRSEVDVYHTGSGAEVTGPPHQRELYRIEL